MDPVRASLPRRSRANHHRIPKLKGNKTLDDEKWRCGSQVTTGARHLYRTSLLVCLGNSGAAEGHQQPCEQNFFPPCGQNTAEQKSTRPGVRRHEACRRPPPTPGTRHAGGYHPSRGTVHAALPTLTLQLASRSNPPPPLNLVKYATTLNQHKNPACCGHVSIACRAHTRGLRP